MRSKYFPCCTIFNFHLIIFDFPVFLEFTAFLNLDEHLRYSSSNSCGYHIIGLKIMYEKRKTHKFSIFPVFNNCINQNHPVHFSIFHLAEIFSFFSFCSYFSSIENYRILLSHFLSQIFTFNDLYFSFQTIISLLWSNILVCN